MVVAPKLLLLLLVFSLGLAGIRADSGLVDEGVDPGVPEDPSPLRRELEKLQSKIASLESSVAEGENQLKVKDESILLFEKIIKEKTDNVASLQDQIEYLQKKVDADAAQLLGKAHVRTAELEKQVEDLKIDIQAQNQKQGALEARAINAERKVEELHLKLENLQSANDEQKKRIKKIERALKVAEEELTKVRFEASLKKKELNEIHGAWLPPWLAGHVVHYKSKAAAHWSNHGKPAYDAFVQKVLEVSAGAKKKIEPHLETAKTIPILKERWVIVRTSVEPYAQSAAARTAELYGTSIKPHLVRAQEAADPYLQDAKKFSKPYIDQAAAFTKPHVEKARAVLKPYTKKAGRLYRKFLRSATTYHRQIQTVVKDNLQRHELTRALATEELVWFAASASLVLPIFAVFQLLAPIFRRKPRRRAQSPQANQTHRRPKRRHADK